MHRVKLGAERTGRTKLEKIRKNGEAPAVANGLKNSFGTNKFSN